MEHSFLVCVEFCVSKHHHHHIQTQKDRLSKKDEVSYNDQGLGGGRREERDNFKVEVCICIHICTYVYLYIYINA
jgi:hypothetical protein